MTLITGTSGNDTLIGTAGADTIDGLAGDDLLQGLDGNDLVTGGGGNDRLDGGAGFDTLNGGNGDDTLIAGGGGDSLDGGNGFDTADYRSSVAGIIVELGTGIVLISLGDDDTLSGIERILATDFNDLLSAATSSSGLTLIFDGRAGNDTINGGAGFDRVDYRDDPSAVSVNLGTGIAFDGYGGVDALSAINEVRGSAFNDLLVGGGAGSGNTGAESFVGLAGNDTINGGSGVDRARYGGSPSGVVVNLQTGLANDGFGSVDTLISIERIEGSSFDDTLIGGNPLGDDFEGFNGGAGNDFIDGRGGFDRAEYANSANAIVASLVTGIVTDGLGGTDRLSEIEALQGSALNDTLIGSGAATLESFEGLAGDDSIDGGGGIDRADYIASAGPVRANLTTGQAQDGFGGIDLLANIENLRGSGFADLLIGNAGPNTIDGQDDNDSLVGGAGADFLIGGDGEDVADYSQDPGPIVASLGAGTVVDGFGATDTLSSIERIVGTAFADTLIGAGSSNGNDSFEGRAGNDSIVGGDGFDDVSYANSPAAATVDLGTGLAQDGFGGVDTLIGIEAVEGSAFNDTLLGGPSQTAPLQSFSGLAGSDVIDGGNGTDRVDYRASPAGVAVNLVTGTAADGFGGTDQVLGIEDIRGSAFDDLLVGDGNDNDIDGGGGDDTIAGGGGNDTLDGASGVDVVSYAAASAGIVLDLGVGAATVGGAEEDEIEDFENVIGSGFDDHLIGDDGNNLLNAGDGNDTLSGSEGEDTLAGDSGDDLLDGGNAADSLSGGAGNDTLLAADGGDSLDGGSGQDSLVGGNGDDAIDGGVDSDQLFGGAGDDSAEGGAGNDSLEGDAGGDTLRGGAGDDSLDGGGDADSIAGDGGTDTLSGGDGDDVLDGGAGGDFASGGNGNDFIDGGDGADSLEGSLGNDVVRGGNGDDSLDGSLGNDTLDGGAGNDWLDGGNGGGTDTVVFPALLASYRFVVAEDRVWVIGQGIGNLGIDELRGIEILTFADQTVTAAQLPALAASGIDGQTILGSAGDELLIGDALNDSIRGGDGADAILGQGGADALSGGNGADVLAGEPGNDLLAGGNAVDVLIGGDGNDCLLGEDGNDVIYGDAGADVMHGGDGDDRITIDADDLSAAGGRGDSDVVVISGAGPLRIDLGDPSNQNGSSAGPRLSGFEGADAGLASAAVSITGGVSIAGRGSLVFGSAFDDTLRGGAADDLIQGGSGSDSIDGGAGNDTIIADAGGDTLTGGAGADNFHFPATQINAVGILDFQPGVDNVLLPASFGLTAAQADAALVQLGQTAVLNVAGGPSILFVGVSAAAITADDFVIV